MKAMAVYYRHGAVHDDRRNHSNERAAARTEETATFGQQSKRRPVTSRERPAISEGEHESWERSDSEEPGTSSEGPGTSSEGPEASSKEPVAREVSKGRLEDVSGREQRKPVPMVRSISRMPRKR